MQRVRLLDGAIMEFPDYMGYEEMMAAADEEWKKRHSQNFERLKTDPTFLNLSRIERQSKFDDWAKHWPGWQAMPGEEHQSWRKTLVDVEGANPLEAEPQVGLAEKLWGGVEGEQGDDPGFIAKTRQKVAEFGRGVTETVPQMPGFAQRQMGAAIEVGANLLDNLTTAEWTPEMEEWLRSQGREDEIEELRRRAGERAETLKPMHQALESDVDAAKNMAQRLDRGGHEMAQAGTEIAENLIGEVKPPIETDIFKALKSDDPFNAVGNWFARGAGNQAPILAAMYLTGRVAGPTGARIAGGGLETGSILEDMESELGTLTPDDRAIALAMGSAAGMLEGMPIANLLKRVGGKKAVKSFGDYVRGTIKSMGRQGAEEFATEVPQTFIEQAALDWSHLNRGELEKMKLTNAEGRKETLFEALNAGILGAAVGGAVGIAGGPNVDVGSQESGAEGEAVDSQSASVPGRDGPAQARPSEGLTVPSAPYAEREPMEGEPETNTLEWRTWVKDRMEALPEVWPQRLRMMVATGDMPMQTAHEIYTEEEAQLEKPEAEQGNVVPAESNAPPAEQNAAPVEGEGPRRLSMNRRPEAAPLEQERRVPEPEQRMTPEVEAIYEQTAEPQRREIEMMMDEVDQAYRSGDHQRAVRLDRVLEHKLETLENQLDERLTEEPGGIAETVVRGGDPRMPGVDQTGEHTVTDLEPLLAQSYATWEQGGFAHGGHPDTIANFASNIRSTLLNAGAATGENMTEFQAKIMARPDEELVEMARDAAKAQEERRGRIQGGPTLDLKDQKLQPQTPVPTTHPARRLSMKRGGDGGGYQGGEQYTAEENAQIQDAFAKAEEDGEQLRGPEDSDLKIAPYVHKRAMDRLRAVNPELAARLPQNYYTGKGQDTAITTARSERETERRATRRKAGPDWKSEGGVETKPRTLGRTTGAPMGRGPRRKKMSMERGGKRLSIRDNADYQHGDQVTREVFFSQLVKTIENAKQKRWKPADLIAWVKKQPGVKAEEIEYTGLEEWLALTDDMVGKGTVVAFLQDNMVELDEVVKAEEKKEAWEEDDISVYDYSEETVYDEDFTPEWEDLPILHTAHDVVIEDAEGNQSEYEVRELDDGDRWELYDSTGEMLGSYRDDTAAEDAARQDFQENYDYGDLEVNWVGENEVRDEDWEPDEYPVIYTVHSYNAVTPDDREQDYSVYEYESEGYWEIHDTNGNEIATVYNEGEIEGEIQEDMAENYPPDEGYGGESEQVKWSEYKEPNGENYTELLMILPNPKTTDITPNLWREIRSLEERIGNLAFVVRKAQAKLGEYRGDKALLADDVLEAQEELKRVQPLMDRLNLRKSELQRINRRGTKTFVNESHFEEENIVVHIRFDERKDGDGNRVLFLEEIQSDWHHDARKATEPLRKSLASFKKQLKFEQENGGTPESIANLEEQVREAERQLEGQTGYQEDFTAEELELQELRGRIFEPSSPEYSAEEEARLGELEESPVAASLDRKVKQGDGGVPDVPYKKNAYIELALKRMVRWAASNGFDRLAWTTGDQQNERYNIRKVVSALEYEGGMLKAYNHAGNVVHRETLTEDELHEKIGKNYAEKLLAQKPTPASGQYTIVDGENKQAFTQTFDTQEEAQAYITRNLVEDTYSIKGDLRDTRRLEGVDLDLGDRGAKAVYDRTIPNVAKKAFKKHKVKIGPMRVMFGSERGGTGFKVVEGTAGGWYVAAATVRGEMVSGPYATEELAQAENKRLNDDRAVNAGTEVWGFVIPENLKRAVLEKGQPLFRMQRRGKGHPAARKAGAPEGSPFGKKTGRLRIEAEEPGRKKLSNAEMAKQARRVFKGSRVVVKPYGVEVRHRGMKPIRLVNVNSTEVTEESLEEYGTTLEEFKAAQASGEPFVIAGAYSTINGKQIVELLDSKDKTVFHESWHWAWENLLSDSDKQKFETEYAAAAAAEDLSVEEYVAEMYARDAVEVRDLAQKIREFLEALLEMIGQRARTTGSVQRELRTGKVGKLQARKVAESGDRASTHRMSPRKASRGTAASPSDGNNIRPADSVYNTGKKLELESIELPVFVSRGKGEQLRVFLVSVDNAKLAAEKDDRPSTEITSLDQAREANTDPERVKDWEEIYANAKRMTEIEDIKKRLAKNSKVANVPIVHLSKGCQRIVALLERIKKGLLPRESRIESCYDSCWVNEGFHTKMGRFENIETNPLQLAEAEFVKKWVTGPHAIKFLTRGHFIRMGQKGDDSHVIASGLAKVWLDAIAEKGIDRKTVFISSSYAPVTAEQYAELAEHKDRFELHFSVSGWFSKNEIMMRLAEFKAARDAGLPARLRVITNVDDISGIKMTNEAFLYEQMDKMGWKQDEVLETPFHDDTLRDKKGVQDRSEPSGKFTWVCCETGYCASCRNKCMTRVPGTGPLVEADFKLDSKAGGKTATKRAKSKPQQGAEVDKGGEKTQIQEYEANPLPGGVREDSWSRATRAEKPGAAVQAKEGGVSGVGEAQLGLFDDQLDEFYGDSNPEAKKLAGEALADLAEIEDAAADEKLAKRVDSISKIMADKGGLALVGQRVQTPEELAAIGQVLRDERFETLRFFFVDAGGNILAQSAVTSRLPNAAGFVPGPLNADPDMARELKRLKRQMERLGATGYYIMHNHPSGDVTLSSDDVALTGRVSRELPGFLAHVVIDSTEANVLEGVQQIEREGRKYNTADERRVKIHPTQYKPPKQGTPARGSLQHRTFLGDPDVVAKYAKEYMMLPGEEKVAVIFLNGRHKAMWVAEFRVDAVKGKGFTDELVGFKKKLGAANAMVVTMNTTGAVKARMNSLMNDQHILDALLIEKASGQWTSVHRSTWKSPPAEERHQGRKASKVKTKRVRENQKEYDAVVKRGKAAGKKLSLERPANPVETTERVESETLADEVEARIDAWFKAKDIAIQEASNEAANIQEKIAEVAGKKRIWAKLMDSLGLDKNMPTWARWKVGKRARKLDLAIQVAVDLRRDPDAKERYWDELSAEQQAVVNMAAEVEADPDLKKIADYVEWASHEAGLEALENNIITNVLEHYVFRVWKTKRGGKSGSGAAKFQQKTKHKLERKYATVVEGWADGHELAIEGASANLEALKTEIAQTLEDKRLIDELSKIKVSPDSVEKILTTKRPKNVTGVPQFGFLPKSWHRKNDRNEYRSFDHPNWHRWLPSGKVVAAANLEVELQDANVRAGDTQYVVRKVDSTRAVAGGVFDSQWAAEEFMKEQQKDSEDQLEMFERVPLLTKQQLFAPAEIAEAFNRVLGSSKLSKYGPVQKLTRANAFLKKLLLMTGFFHHQAYLRSFYLGVGEPIGPRKAYREGIDAVRRMTPDMRLLIGNGLTVGRQQEWQEGGDVERGRMMKALRKNGATRDTMDFFKAFQERQATFLFQRMGAGLKAKSALIELQRRRKKYPGVDDNLLAKQVATLINADFGGLHLQRMYRDPTTQHFFRLFALAPDWTESNIQTMIRMVQKKGDKGPDPQKMYRHFWGALLARGLALTTLLNMIMAGIDDDDDFFDNLMRALEQPTKLRWLQVDVTALRDLVYKMLGKTPEDTKKYFSIIGHFGDPIKFIVNTGPAFKHKQSVLGKVVMELLTGKDWKGHRFTTWAEFLGLDDKGYTASGEKKGGQLKLRLTTPAGRGDAVSWSTSIGTWAAHTALTVLPIQAQEILGYALGESDGWDAVMHSIGAHVKSTYRSEAIERMDKVADAVREEEHLKVFGEPGEQSDFRQENRDLLGLRYQQARIAKEIRRLKRQITAAEKDKKPSAEIKRLEEKVREQEQRFNDRWKAVMQ